MKINFYIKNVFQLAKLTLHLSQVLPVNLGLHSHCPVVLSHCDEREPNGSHSHDLQLDRTGSP